MVIAAQEENATGLEQNTDTRTRAQHLFEALRERICLLQYQPGSVLRERDLAEEFGISRTPIRTVLQRLEFEGLTYSRQGHGTIVTGVDLNRLKEIYFLRIKLAELIGSSSTPGAIGAVTECVDQLLAHCEIIRGQIDLEGFGRINIGLHKAVQQLLCNRSLIAISDTLFYQTARMWFKILTDNDWGYEIDNLVEEMRAIRRYLGAGDLESVGYVRRNHLSIVARKLDSISFSLSQECCDAGAGPGDLTRRRYFRRN